MLRKGFGPWGRGFEVTSHIRAQAADHTAPVPVGLQSLP